MRMCGHAHHDDMLYLGRDPHPSWDYPGADRAGVRRSRAVRVLGGARSDRHLRGAARSRRPIVTAADVARFRAEAEAIVERRGAGDRRRAVAGTAGRPGIGVFAGEAPRVHVEVLDPEVRLKADATIATLAARSRTAGRSEGADVSRGRHARRRRCASRRSARVRVRPGRRRQVRQRVPAAAAAAERVRRPDPQLAARRGRDPRRLRRRGARRPAADRRDSVQRLRRDRLQPARQQRREDSLPVGRGRADGRADAVRRAASRRTLSLAEHRSVVLPDAGPEDRRARRRRTTRAR